MKKLLKIGGYSLLSLIVIIAIVLIFINSKGIPSYTVEKVETTILSTPKSVERGRKLAMMICANCHLNHSTGKFTGKELVDAPPEFGTIFSANITGDTTYGIGKYTDGELIRLLRTGIARDGRYLPPYMAKLPSMAHEDIAAIISFLRSGESMVKSEAVQVHPSEPSLLTKVLCYTMFKPLPMPTKKIALPDTTDRIALGRYLAVNLECFSCHSADFKTNDFLHPENSAGYFGGGNKPLNLQGEVILTPNLTSHETGIKNWTEEQFIRTVKYGQRLNKPAVQYPMQPYTLLTDYEAGSIYQYLRTIPPIDNKVQM